VEFLTLFVNSEVAGAVFCRAFCHDVLFQLFNVELELQVIRPQNLSFKFSFQSLDLLLQRGYFSL
jgi:hypothetical protein